MDWMDYPSETEQIPDYWYDEEEPSEEEYEFMYWLEQEAAFYDTHELIQP